MKGPEHGAVFGAPYDQIRSRPARGEMNFVGRAARTLRPEPKSERPVVERLRAQDGSIANRLLDRAVARAAGIHGGGELVGEREVGALSLEVNPKVPARPGAEGDRKGARREPDDAAHPQPEERCGPGSSFPRSRGGRHRGWPGCAAVIGVRPDARRPGCPPSHSSPP